MIKINIANTQELSENKRVTEILNNDFCRMLMIELQDGAILTKHRSAEPISVQCISGSGTFFAGPELDDSQSIETKDLIILDANIEHEVRAQPDIKLLVTKFKQY